MKIAAPSGPSPPAKLIKKATAKKSAETVELLVASLRRMLLFSDFKPELLPAIAQAAEVAKAREGEAIIEQGSLGKELYIVESGEYGVTTNRTGEQILKVYASGDSFGELALMYNAPRAATITCSKACALHVLSRDALDTIFSRAAAKQLQEGGGDGAAARAGNRKSVGPSREAAAQPPLLGFVHTKLLSVANAQRKLTSDAQGALALLQQERGVKNELGALLLDKLKDMRMADLLKSWDKDGDGTIDAAEFKKEVQRLGLKAEDDELDLLFASLDDSGIGEAVPPRCHGGDTVVTWP